VADKYIILGKRNFSGHVLQAEERPTILVSDEALGEMVTALLRVALNQVHSRSRRPQSMFQSVWSPLQSRPRQAQALTLVDLDGGPIISPCPLKAWGCYGNNCVVVGSTEVARGFSSGMTALSFQAAPPRSQRRWPPLRSGTLGEARCRRQPVRIVPELPLIQRQFCPHRTSEGELRGFRNQVAAL
jgi:hypothetical protein